MTKIRLRQALLGLLVAVPMLLMGISGGAAYADGTGGAAARAAAATGGATVMDAGNNNASIVGVPFCSNINQAADCWTWENTVQVDCPSGHFCLYTNSVPTNGGKIFALYHCREYSLSNWNDRGFVHNNNTGGAAGYLRDRNHVNLQDGTFPAGHNDWYNFAPVWYVQAC